MLNKKKRLPITGKPAGRNHTNVKRIKPQRARRIIRRYHFLNSSRKKLLYLLKLQDDNDKTNIDIEKLCASNSDFSAGYNEFGNGDLDNDREEQLKRDLLSIYTHKQDTPWLWNLLGRVEKTLSERGNTLSNYQSASLSGQDSSRGGDSSKLLVKWMRELIDSGEQERYRGMSALEIGSLSNKNMISRVGIFNPVVRIDLNNSNDDDGIIKQDFMERPLPRDDSERFDLISCSLVLNFVPTPIERGNMCRRFEVFLKKHSVPNRSSYVFIVLPLPCVANSRYMDSPHFIQLMTGLGYEVVRQHMSRKLCYYLFRRVPGEGERNDLQYYRKIKIRDGPNMNNFAILLPHQG